MTQIPTVAQYALKDSGMADLTWLSEYDRTQIEPLLRPFDAWLVALEKALAKKSHRTIGDMTILCALSRMAHGAFAERYPEGAQLPPRQLTWRFMRGLTRTLALLAACQKRFLSLNGYNDKAAALIADFIDNVQFRKECVLAHSIGGTDAVRPLIDERMRSRRHRRAWRHVTR